MDFYPSVENPYLHQVPGLKVNGQTTLRPDQLEKADADQIRADLADEATFLQRYIADALLPGLEELNPDTFALPDGWYARSSKRWGNTQKDRWIRVEAAILKCRAYKAEFQRRADMAKKITAASQQRAKAEAEQRLAEASKRLNAFKEFAEEALEAAGLLRDVVNAIRVIGAARQAEREYGKLVQQLSEASQITGKPMPKIEPITWPNASREIAILNPGNAHGDTGASYPTAF